MPFLLSTIFLITVTVLATVFAGDIRNWLVRHAIKWEKSVRELAPDVKERLEALKDEVGSKTTKLTEGKIKKGGLNQKTSIKKRPAKPASMKPKKGPKK